MYKQYPSLVLGFHACDREVGESILAGEKGFKASENAYDWLGHGMYFWETSVERARDYSLELKEKRGKIKEPFVIGAVIHLGYCFDLLDCYALKVLQSHYQQLTHIYKTAGLTLPINKSTSSTNTDKLLRSLDCAVIQYMHSEMLEKKERNFDTVRGAFWEGEELYPSAGFKEKNHIQLCVRNPNCIKGYFRPLEINIDYPRV